MPNDVSPNKLGREDKSLTKYGGADVSPTRACGAEVFDASSHVHPFDSLDATMYLTDPNDDPVARTIQMPKESNQCSNNSTPSKAVQTVTVGVNRKEDSQPKPKIASTLQECNHNVLKAMEDKLGLNLTSGEPSGII